MKTNNSYATALFFATASVAPSAAYAQANLSTPYLQDSSISGFGSTISINRLPISVSGGRFVFKDVTITLATTDDNGTLNSVAKVTQKVSPTLYTSNIIAGLYGRSDSTSNQLTVTGPAAIGSGGEAEWTTTLAQGGGACGAPSDFYTGPLTKSPLYSRLHAAGITSTQYSYGVIGSGSQCNSPFATGTLIGVSQVGNELQIASFTNNGQDQSSPVSSYIYNLIQ